jgi:hypothetical protein
MWKKPTTWEDMVQVDNGHLHCIPFSSDIHNSRSDYVALYMITPHFILFWFLMFVLPLHLQQEIAEASDDAARKYYEEIPKVERTSPGVTTVMRAAAKTKQ